MRRDSRAPSGACYPAVMRSLEIAIVVEAGDWPAEAALEALARRAVDAAVAAMGEEAPSGPSPNPSPQGGGEQELSIVFTDDAAIRRLNARYRGRDQPTNVLSFPQPGHPEAGPQLASPLLGDVILAAETLAREATLASKPLEDHMSHLIIHGFLHLLGYHHETEPAAEKMEQLERVALKKLGIEDPYASA